jgi:hypothetical protein
LIVVPDDHEVSVGLRQQRDELRLRRVRVLELIDKDVAVPPGHFPPGRGRGPKQPQGQGHLVPEVDEAVHRQELLVAAERPGELAEAIRLLECRGGVLPGYVRIRCQADSPLPELAGMPAERLRTQVFVLAA